MKYAAPINVFICGVNVAYTESRAIADSLRFLLPFDSRTWLYENQPASFHQALSNGQNLGIINGTAGCSHPLIFARAPFPKRLKAEGGRIKGEVEDRLNVRPEGNNV